MKQRQWRDDQTICGPDSSQEADRALLEMGVPAAALKVQPDGARNRCGWLGEHERALLLDVIKKSHEAEIHVELLVAVEEREARIVGDEVHFRFLIATEH